MEQIVYNLTAIMLPPVEKPWLEPYDSTAKINYYMFENNKRLRFIHRTLEESRINKEDDADILLYMTTYPNGAMNVYGRNGKFNATIPVTESCLRFFSRKNATVRVEYPGLFDEILNMPVEIWIGVAMAFVFLTTIEIIEKRIVGIKKKVLSCVYDNTFQQFGALLGKGYDMSPLPAIRLATGPWILQIVVLFTLLCAVLKANSLKNHQKNIDSVKDYMRGSSYLGLYPMPNDEYDICHSTYEDMKIACEFIRKTKKQRASPKPLPVHIYQMSTIIFALEKYGNIFKQAIYMGSNGYLCQPLIYIAGNTINPTALKLVNNRLRSFVETSQITPWHRYLEKKWGFNIQPKPTTPVENEVRKIDWKNVEMAFAVWATQLGVAMLVAILELIIGFEGKN